MAKKKVTDNKQPEALAAEALAAEALAAEALAAEALAAEEKKPESQDRLSVRATGGNVSVNGKLTVTAPGVVVPEHLTQDREFMKHLSYSLKIKTIELSK